MLYPETSDRRAGGSEPACVATQERVAVRALGLLLLGCSLIPAVFTASCTQATSSSAFAEVSIEQLRTEPAAWMGRPVELEGVVSVQSGVASTLRENCSSTAHSLQVRWDSVPGFRVSDDGAKVRVRGVFHQDEGGARDGTLRNVSIIWRLPPNLPRCLY
jgi:hypothetical protein